jgi:hypothetical protein
MTPAMPNYLPSSASSPLPSFAPFESFEHVSLEKSFGDFATTFSQVVDQPCAMSELQDQHCGAGADGLSPFRQPQIFGELDFSAFMDPFQATFWILILAFGYLPSSSLLTSHVERLLWL